MGDYTLIKGGIMLSEKDICFLQKQDIDIKEVESFNDKTLEVVFKNGNIRTCALTFTRIMGYYREFLHDANIGKRQEIKERKHFNIKEEQC